MARNYLNNIPATTLNGDVTAIATTWTVADGTGYPATPFAAKCANEVVEVTAKSGVNDVDWTVTRGFDNTSGAAHASGAVVTDAVIAADMDAIWDSLPLAGGTMDADGTIVTVGSAATSDVITAEVSGDSYPRLVVDASGDLWTGTGAAAAIKSLTLSVDGTTTLGRYAGALNTSSGNTAIGGSALGSNTSGFDNTAGGYTTLLLNVSGRRSTAFGSSSCRAVTAHDDTGFGFGSLYSPAGVSANATTSGTRQTGIGIQTGQASTTQRNDIVAVGYRALVDANDTVALGSGAQALHANGVALGKGIVTTAINQVAIGPNHIEGTEMTAPAAGAANSWRIYGVDNGAGKTQLMCQFATGAAQQLSIEP